MAEKKIIVEREDLSSLSSRIRTKAESNADSLIWPNGFISAVDSIETGRGGLDPTGITATSADILDGVYTFDSTGTLVEGTIPIQTPTNISLTTADQMVTVSSGYYSSSFTARIASSAVTGLSADSMLSTATVLGITGNIPTISPSKEELLTVTDYATIPLGYNPTVKTITIASSAVSDLNSNNILAGNTILGVTGSIPIQSISNPIISAVSQSISIPSGYYAFDTAISIKSEDQAKLIPQNIKSGITILGITGTAEAGSGEGESAELKEFIERQFTSINNSTASFIGEYAFYSHSSLLSINFPNCTTIGGYAFQNCTSLTSINFPSCTTINTRAFQNCTSLTSINFPVCTTIGSYAFWNCTPLTSANFPSCTIIGNYAFYSCTSLASIDFPVCTTIGNYAFELCNKLTSIDFPSCTTISDNAFALCYSLASINFPVCTTIGDSAFTGCNKLTSIDFSVCTTINDSAFYSCTSLISINFPVCTTIGSSAFQNCTSLTSANFPSCTTIGNFAFYSCTSLTSINFPSCTTINTRTFQFCTSLTSIDFPVCTTIGNYAFWNCTSLTSANFPSCTIIGDSAFYSCTSLISINFPSCTTIGGNAFAQCKSLTSVNFPSCTTIGVQIFSNCTKLQTAYFPKLLSLNSTSGFAGRSYLQNVTIYGRSTSAIQASTFRSCYRLTNLTILRSEGVAPLAAKTAFGSTPISTYTTYTSGARGSIYVPASLVDAYKSATNWATYANQITAIPEE